MDNSIIIDNLLASKKDKSLSLFESVDIDKLGQTLCAYLNSTGGDIILGMSSDNTPTGINKNWKSKITNDVINKLIPSAPATNNTISYKDKDILLISVWSGANKPYSFKGKIYVHDGGEIKMASPRALKSLSSNRKKSEFHWERQVVLGADIEELNQQEIKKTIKEYIKSNPGINKLEVEDFLLKTGLLQGGSLTNAAIILFAENPFKYLPQCKIRTTVYDSSKAGKVILFDRIYNRSLFENIQSIWDFYETHLKRGEKISGLLRTKEALPLEALREGLLNAVIHRDYSRVSSTLNIEVYPDKLVISNTGNLPESMSVRDLKKDHDSILRNPDISYICHVRGLIEMLGTGTLRMIADCEDNGYPEPKWRTKGDKLELTLEGISHRIKNDGLSDGLSDGVNIVINDGVSDGVINGVSDGVKNEIAAIIKLLAEDEGINTDNIVESLASKSKPTIERYLKMARQLNMVIFKGSSKTGGYYLTDKIKRFIK